MTISSKALPFSSVILGGATLLEFHSLGREGLKKLYHGKTSNPPKSPFSKGGLYYPPLEKGGRAALSGLVFAMKAARQTSSNNP
jgi:hypothetical protein